MLTPVLATNPASLISPDNAWGLWAVILVGVALSIYLDKTYRWAARLSGPVLALFIAMLLSNLGVLPMASPTYDVISDYLVPIAVSLLLFRASLLDIVRTSRMAFIAMQIAVTATAIGALAAGLVLHDWNAPDRAESSSVGQLATSQVTPSFSSRLPEIAGLMAASYAGGGVNFVAVKEIYNIDDGLTSSLLVADNFVMAAAFLVMFRLASLPWMRRHFPHPHSLKTVDEAPPEEANSNRPARSVSLSDLAISIAIAGTLAATSNFIAQGVGHQFSLLDGETASPAARLILQICGSLASSKFVWITLLSITVATIFADQLKQLTGTDELGGYLLFLFLFSIGIPCDFMSVILNVPVMFALCLIIAAVNLVLTLAVGKLLRMNLEELLLACNASLGGPPTAAAMAVSMGWNRLATTGLLIGLWGYAVGTAVGVAVTEVLRQLPHSA
ncbi:MAG: hypothetical protein C0478_11325 [Planctomyces sp.]|nr:hypothetical protein [Planctomyces sp.]